MEDDGSRWFVEMKVALYPGKGTRCAASAKTWSKKNGAWGSGLIGTNFKSY